MAASGTIPLDEREEDINEKENIVNFVQKGCGCQRGQHKTPCSRIFSSSFVSEQRDRSHSLTDEQLDMVVLGQLMSHRRSPIFLQDYQKMRPHRRPEHHSEESLARLHENFRHTTKYFVHDIPVCETTYCFLHTLSKRRLQNLQTHFDCNGLTPRVHGLTGISPKISYGPDTIQDVVTFIQSVAEERSIPLPGRLPGVKNIDDVKLPSDMSKAAIHREYTEAANKAGKQPVSLTTFCSIWLKYVPEISIMKPQTDLCPVCQENNIMIRRSSGMPDEEKEERYNTALNHIKKADCQRSHYKKQCQGAKEQVQDEKQPEAMTYSFDYAQNLTYPYSSQQVGPAYFKSARRCGLFGVLCEGSGDQVNYLIDECETVGKGANTVISMLHHYFDNAEKVEKIMLHADNCCGQNKNNMVMQYLSWRVLMDWNTDIEISFMLPGHTKFGPDRMFGMIKKKFYVSEVVDTLDDIVKLVTSSTLQQKNKAILTCDYVREVRTVIWYDWSTFLNNFFKPIPGILGFQHFRMEKDSPFLVFTRTGADAEEQTHSIQKKGGQDVHNSGMPPIITPTGLDPQRQWYLYEQVASLCNTKVAGSLTCPRPELPKPRKRKHREE